MNIYYNPNYIFKNVDKDKTKIYLQRIDQLAKAINNTNGEISKDIIDQFKMKKMKGTNDIFKFYLNNSDATRLLFKYDREPSSISSNKQGLILLYAVGHDDQGILGKKLDNRLISLENFLLYGDDINEDEDLEFELEQELNRQIFKMLPLSLIHNDDLIQKMEEVDNNSMYRLSFNQKRALKASGPVFIRGSAGSGKTFVAIAKALKNAHNKSSQAYFTFTPLLRDNAHELYNKYDQMDGINGSVSFNVMNEYFIKQLDLKSYQHFDFRKFKQWIKQNSYRSRYKWMNDIDIIHLWTEIRGLIKGYIGNDYYRILTSDKINDLLSKDEIADLLRQNIIKRANNSKSVYHIINSSELYKRYQYTNIHEHLITNDSKVPIIDEFSYIETLSASYSLFDKQTRKNLLKFTNEIYQPYLNENNLYDDNDLARLTIKKTSSGSIDKFDYIIIDEVQDLTEMQIIALSKLSKDIRNVMMTGDNSQVINPTFFLKGRTGLIFRNIFNVTLNNDIILNTNYRNSEEIVKVIAKLLEVRQDKLGTYSEDIKEVAGDLDKKAGLPIFIDLNQNDVRTAIGMWINVPKVAVIVSSDEVKRQLEHKHKVEGETNIYSVHEIKGQEFSKIITYNIISDHQDYWDDIMNNKVSKSSDLVNSYKYYFNLLYVAITRGRENVFMYEDNKHSLIVNEVIDLFERINKETINVLDVSEYDTDKNRLLQAEQYFLEEDYLRAKTMYMRLNDRQMVELSDGYYDIFNTGKIEEGLINLYGVEKRYKEFIFDRINKDEHLLLYVLYGYNLGMLSIDEINDLTAKISIIRAARKYNDKNNYHLILKDSIKLMGIVKKHRVSKKIRGY